MELKNCPFCGGEAFVRKLYTNYFVDAKHGENCPMCYMCLPYDSRWVTREAAVGAWNMRYHCSPSTFDIENIVKDIVHKQEKIVKMKSCGKKTISD